MLDMLANGRIGEYRELAAIAPDALVHLVGYELVDPTRHAIRLEALQTFLQLRGREARSASHPARRLEQGAVLHEYEIVQSLSSGGFGDVYKVRDAKGGIAALKVFHSGSLEQLTREMEALKNLRHENVVRVISDDTADGIVYLVTEFLEGETLEKHCSRSFRQNDGQTEDVLRALLGALASFHPNQERLDELRAKDELTPEELDELPVVRAGLVHRDIKPANVIVVNGRGPVLIDFGIASRIAAPVKTMSATPGYLPPDFDRTGWSADVDLYQLGLTLLQTRLGAHYDGSYNGVEELRELLRSEAEVGEHLKQVLRKITEPERGNRYRSAGAVARALGPHSVRRASASGAPESKSAQSEK
jgi:serine/threonine-protein kinase